MSKVLVTGATGFIGNHVVKHLLDQGQRVIASSTSKEHAQTKEWFSKVEYKQFNLAEVNPEIDYFSFFGKPDRLIHLAWEGLPNYQQEFHLTSNLPKHKAFLGNLLGNGLKDLTVTGTCFEYGLQEGELSEEAASLPVTVYGRAKNELRVWLEARQRTDRFVCKWLRLFYMYGKGQGVKSLVSQLDEALDSGATVFNMSGGEQVRDFLPVELMSYYIVRVALQQEVKGIINCCSGHPISVKEFVLTLLKERAKTITLNLGYYPYSEYEPMRFWGNNSKLKKVLTNE